MQFTEYVELVDQEIPDMQASLLNIAPPEMLKMVAVRLYMSRDYDSLLAQVTREQLVHISKQGMTNFDLKPKAGPDTIESKVKGRGPSDFA